ncbi:MAG TPA: MFS transporter [Candidatus Sumerlaeota bacterium]|nr:MFS transporter [Candidatus Sumerlaeota bacterium]
MKNRKQWFLFVCGVTALAVSSRINDSIFNNYLKDVFDIKAQARGQLEFPRELPGFLVVLMAGLLAALPVTRLGLVGGIVMAVGTAGLGLVGAHWYPMLGMMMLGSAGMHLLQPTTSSIAIGLSKAHERGKRLGEMGAFQTVGTLIGCGFVFLMFDDKTPPRYNLAFLCAGGVAVVSALLFGLMYIPHLHQPRSRLVIKRKYGLYYILELFFGARKQIFITFGPWVLIKVYDARASDIAGLFVIASILGIGFKPIVGWAIDRFGERTVMIADGLTLIFVCLGYGYAFEFTGDMRTAHWLASGCFVLDEMLFAMGTSRAVYASRLTDSPQELASTLSMGISVNHIVSMIIPAVAGIIWDGYGYQRLFAAAAVFALITAGVSSLTPRKGVLSGTDHSGVPQPPEPVVPEAD